jgi:hypothetical protein
LKVMVWLAGVAGEDGVFCVGAGAPPPLPLEQPANTMQTAAASAAGSRRQCIRVSRLFEKGDAAHP